MMRQNAPRPARRRTRAFTLIELLVSMTVLSIIVLLISQLFSSATNVTVGNRKRLDADAQARLVFDHLALDFGKMLKRTDVDYLFAKVTSTSTGQAQNDAMFFYSEAPAFFDGAPSPAPAASTPDPRSSVALVGYRINKAFQLERLGKQLSWDGATASSTPGGIMCLSPSPTPPPPSTPDLNILDAKSTLPGNWPDVIGTTASSPAYTDATDDADYQVLAEQVCRLEICFQLKDGNYSPLPVCPVPAANLPALPAPTGNTSPRTPASINYATTGPTLNADANSYYVVGSRWYDTTAGRPYVCTDNTAGAAVWKPLGMQDVRAVVVALAILDGTSSRTVRTVSVTMDNRNLQVPKLDSLAGVLADANPGDILSPGTASSALTVPSFSTPPPTGMGTPVPSRLMAEAWTNETRQATFAHDSGLPGPVAAQVRVYQRSFVLNNQ